MYSVYSWGPGFSALHYLGKVLRNLRHEGCSMLYRVVSWLFVKICDLWSCFKSAFIFIHLLQCSSYVFTGSPDACRNYQCVSGVYVLQPRPGAHWTKILIEAWSLWYLFTVFYIFSTIGCVVMSLFYLALIRSQLTSTRKNTMRPCFCWSTHFWSMKSLSLQILQSFFETNTRIITDLLSYLQWFWT